MGIKKQIRAESCISRAKLFKAMHIDRLTISDMARVFHTQNRTIEEFLVRWGIMDAKEGSPLYDELSRLCN